MFELMKNLSTELAKYAGSVNSGELIALMDNLSKQTENYSGFLKDIHHLSSQTIKLMEGVHSVSTSIHDRDYHFIETHNKIITSLNRAQAGHKWALESYLALVEKKTSFIAAFNIKLGEFNQIIERTRREASQLSTTFRAVNTHLLNNKQYLEDFKSGIDQKIIESSNKAVFSFFRKTRWLLIINVISLIAIFILLRLKGF